jgi:hypothetical protein
MRWYHTRAEAERAVPPDAVEFSAELRVGSRGRLWWDYDRSATTYSIVNTACKSATDAVPLS